MEEEAVPQQMSEPRLAELHAELVAREDLQFDFPPYVEPKPPAWADALVRFFEAIGPILKIVFWVGLAIGVLLIVYFAAREVQATWTRRRKAREAVQPADWAPEPEKAKALLEDADRLAAEGRFEEAVHLLLFRSIDDLAGRRPEAVRPALTSRDIARIEAMPGPARSAFSRIAEAVEKSFFGGRPLGQSEFVECRRAYEAFAFAEGWA
ncbi:DUF4129 domain-containing protein [Phenylobacterium terrae]|uniref:DUF4129 domain-containing protein n=1 Tax=Phenylobacterium terrae TaxID=2665495 RepID=A0ABW4MYH7_9CAUL